MDSQSYRDQTFRVALRISDVVQRLLESWVVLRTSEDSWIRWAVLEAVGLVLTVFDWFSYFPRGLCSPEFAVRLLTLFEGFTWDPGK